MPHSPQTPRGKQLTPRTAGLLQKFYAFVGREHQEAVRSDEDRPRLQLVVARLRTQLVNARFPLEGAEEDQLRASVYRYVELMKAAGQPSEEVVIALKRILRETGVQSDGPVADTGSGSTRLWDRVVAWCIQRYYFGEI